MNYCKLSVSIKKIGGRVRNSKCSDLGMYANLQQALNCTMIQFAYSENLIAKCFEITLIL